MKICTECKISKEELEFYKKPKGKNGLHSFCKKCCSKAVSKRSKDRKLGLPSVLKVRHKEHGEKGSQDYQTSTSLKSNYGITIKEYNKLLTLQNGCCAICKRHHTEFSRRLDVDHDHKSGKIRGLLCSGCNRGLGYFKDSEQLLDQASEYIKINKIGNLE